jgi:2-desacetyl-2-hydroxyethyl bacteriochlorophyllide A dehydrogenase
MKKLIWRGGDDLRIEHSSQPLPEPGRDEVLLRVKAVGICGTDIHILRGTVPFAKPPLILGHEISGEIAAVGKGVSEFYEGDRVTVDAVIGCGHCDLCKISRYQFCPETFELGITRDGGCQEYVIVPKRNVYPIAGSVSFEEAAILDMEVYGAVLKCGVLPTDHVLVLGAGPIGVIACQIARILAAAHITLSDVLESRLNTAKTLSVADTYLVHTENGSSPESRGTPSDPYDLVIDCAGTAQSANHAFAAVRPSGRVLLYGVHEYLIDQFDLNQIVLKDLTVLGAQSDRTGWEVVIALVTSGALNLKGLVTHRFPLEEAPQAYNLVRSREEKLIKAVILL